MSNRDDKFEIKVSKRLKEKTLNRCRNQDNMNIITKKYFKPAVGLSLILVTSSTILMHNFFNNSNGYMIEKQESMVVSDSLLGIYDSAGEESIEIYKLPFSKYIEGDGWVFNASSYLEKYFPATPSTIGLPLDITFQSNEEVEFSFEVNSGKITELSNISENQTDENDGGVRVDSSENTSGMTTLPIEDNKLNNYISDDGEEKTAPDYIGSEGGQNTPSFEGSGISEYNPESNESSTIINADDLPFIDENNTWVSSAVNEYSNFSYKGIYWNPITEEEDKSEVVLTIKVISKNTQDVITTMELIIEYNNGYYSFVN